MAMSLETEEHTLARAEMVKYFRDLANRLESGDTTVLSISVRPESDVTYGIVQERTFVTVRDVRLAPTSEAVPGMAEGEE